MSFRDTAFMGMKCISGNPLAKPLEYYYLQKKVHRHNQQIQKNKIGDCGSQKGTLRQGSIPAKPRFRSVPDVVVLNSRTLTGLLIKCRRLPRGFFWNTSLPPLGGWLFCFLKSECWR